MKWFLKLSKPYTVFKVVSGFRLNSSPAAWLTCLLCSRDQRSESGQLVLKLYTKRLHAEFVAARRVTSTCGWWSYAVVCSKGTRGVTSVTGWLTCLRKAPHSIPSTICDRSVWQFAAYLPLWLRALSVTISYPANGLLGAFAKLRKVTINFVMSACLSLHSSVHMKHVGSHWTDFREIWYMSIFRKSVEKVQVSLKYDQNNR